MKQKIKVKLLGGQLPKVINKGEWIDLSTVYETSINAPQALTLRKHTVNGVTESHRDVTFNWAMIPLGVAMKLPAGFEAVIVPRSSTFKRHGIIQANSIGIIDNSYCGNLDEWKLPVIALTDTTIPPMSRICQFRIQLSQKATLWQKIKWFLCSGIKLIEVNKLNSEDRGGFGSTGVI